MSPTFESVSYTHLDVYKRQVLSWSLWKAFWTMNSLLNPPGTLMELAVSRLSRDVSSMEDEYSLTLRKLGGRDTSWVSLYKSLVISAPSESISWSWGTILATSRSKRGSSIPTEKSLLSTFSDRICARRTCRCKLRVEDSLDDSGDSKTSSLWWSSSREVRSGLRKGALATYEFEADCILFPGDPTGTGTGDWDIGGLVRRAIDLLLVEWEISWGSDMSTVNELYVIRWLWDSSLLAYNSSLCFVFYGCTDRWLKKLNEIRPVWLLSSWWLYTCLLYTSRCV